MAILAVVVHHYFPRFGSMGWCGVDLFFVLSGFLIGGILIDSKGAPNYFRDFYLRRLFRIAPLYILMCIIALPMHRLFEMSLMPWHAYTFTANLWIAHHGWGQRQYLDVSWSLSSEEQFYLVLPLLIWITSRRNLPWILGVLAIISLVPSFGSYTLRCDGLMLGVLAALLMRSPARSYLVSHPRLLLASLAAATFFMAASFPRAAAVPGWEGSRFFSFTAVLLFFVVLLSVLCHRNTLLARACRARWLRWLGAISYCVYLIHVPVLHVANALVPHGGAVVSTAALCVSLALSTISWRYFEAPLIRIGRALEDNRSRGFPATQVPAPFFP